MVSATLDPDGRRVVLTEERWDHIKRRHPDLAPRLREIMEAVREPDRRLPGRAEGEERFLRHMGGTLPWLHVAVHYEGGEGWIATAFRREAPPR